MKWQSIVILVVIAVGFLLPPALPQLAERGQHAEIGNLDVCHSSMPAFASLEDMPCIGVAFEKPSPAHRIAFASPNEPLFLQSPMSLGSEHPPKA